jgi:hypothetical protein
MHSPFCPNFLKFINKKLPFAISPNVKDGPGCYSVVVSVLQVKDWVDRIIKDWKFKSIIPCHFSAPIPAQGRDLRVAFEFLNDLLPEEAQEKSPAFAFSLATIFSKASSSFPAADMKTLFSLDDFLVSIGAVQKTMAGKARR